MRSDWTIPLCTGEERLKDGSGRKLHPTQKPEALVARAILSASKPGDVVLDPFFGTGTTGAAARRLGRHYIGVERNPTYAARAEARIAATEPLPSPSIAPFMTAREAPRVAFNILIERGLVKAGAQLTDAKGRVQALVRPDGTLTLKSGKDASVGSIHRIGALAQGIDACNGWTYWHVEDAGGRRPIDSLRAQIRAEMAHL
jgi:modification methylase